MSKKCLKRTTRFMPQQDAQAETLIDFEIQKTLAALFKRYFDERQRLRNIPSFRPSFFFSAIINILCTGTFFW